MHPAQQQKGTPVVVTDVDISFGRWIVIWIKSLLALLVVYMIFAVVFGLIFVIFAAIFGGLQNITTPGGGFN
jgi:ABC-type multidrug transport system permease subunit